MRPSTAARGDYFPERTLARWLESQGLPSTVYALCRTTQRGGTSQRQLRECRARRR
ncbi:hypothetical protein ACFYWP_24240 [Actinacidiphila glaucinigra]|uniref:hypothetical protein n=1 Tax=Actinacidiphila glaucinigra TaxID=235986 RepID=UPI003682C524